MKLTIAVAGLNKEPTLLSSNIGPRAKQCTGGSITTQTNDFNNKRHPVVETAVQRDENLTLQRVEIWTVIPDGKGACLADRACVVRFSSLML